MQLQGGIQTFGEKYGLDTNRTYRLQICCEELIYELISHCYPNESTVDISIQISYAETDRMTKINLRSGGQAFDPFTQEDDALGVTILKRMSKHLNYRYENGQNKIDIIL